jgi:undecaprenyl-phosphate galactose phosphotransferase/putative colanic acid biosynthesis UDP-glucose lipid carrier transferase
VAGVTTYLSQSTNQPPSSAQATLDHAFEFVSYGNIGVLVAAADFLAITLLSVVAGLVYHYFAFRSVADCSALLGIGANSGILFGLLTASRGFYRTRNILSGSKQANNIISAWISVLLVVTALLFLLKVGSSYSRGSTIAFGLLGLPVLLGVRALFRREFNKRVLVGSISGPRCILIGDQEELHELSPLDLLQKFGIREVGRFEFPLLAEVNHEIAIIDSAIAAARHSNAEQVLLALGWADVRRRDLLAKMLRALPMPVLLLPDRFARPIFSQATAEFDGATPIELQRAPLTKLEMAAKRTVDLVLAGTGLIALLPLLAMVALAVRIDSRGPVIFRQSRRGFNGREFMIWKFRTMTVLENGGTICQAKRRDERITRVGRLLRVTSIDELPQLINVLRGEMSLVGPRPHAVAHDDEYGRSIGKYAFRHHVKPGITGWAQVNGFRGETRELDLMKDRINLDLWYINNWNIWLDLWIIIRTCFEVARSRNAY